MKSIEKLTPYIVSKIWGGTKLKELKGLETDESQIGETWEVSRHQDGPSQCDLGSLNEMMSHDELPYLVKYIDTTDNLSVQVHPGDQYAARVEKSSGKTECWIILEAESDAGIYLGFKPEIEKKEFKKAVMESGEVHEFLNFYPVKKGTFVFVPAGSVHAIGKGITLAEVQQSSGITYRVWDWNRVDDKGNSRELHIDKAMDVLNFDPECNTSDFFKFNEDIFNSEESLVIEHKDFNVLSVCKVKGESYHCSLPGDKRFKAMLVLEGSVDLELDDQNEKVNKYETVLIHKQVQRIEVNCLEDSKLLFVY